MYATTKFHMFFTYSKRENTRNLHFGSAISGDAFFLKLSDTKDEHGRKFYVNLEPEDWTKKELEYLIRVFPYIPRYYTDEANGGEGGPTE